ncbi:hypothetical protein Q9L42_002320 [Methylomarinum sp. Ch1-1]|uniref:Uncharacterized protein n=1 Tax=Methylomarinum roseum TaxID=3067653 RepID=A0AAU7NVJ1_9GAMM|nr:hypothetical protein [Methylomarinum sp. Ch1-1]MDP4522988.1 hypothetical protein [Methylomarinum sp. Ch1-1]
MQTKLSLGLSALSLVLASQTAISQPHYNVNDYYQVYKEGRIYIFDDFTTYDSFNNTGETPFRLTRIGAGPHGETLVFGLSEQDKTLRSGLGSTALYDGNAQGIAEGFYGEVSKDGRIYVFGAWQDLQSFLKVGEAPLRYTQIGSGPAGETVVYVLNEDNKEQKPEALIAEFKHKHDKK